MITTLRGMLKGHVSRIFLWTVLVVLIFGGMLSDYSDNKPWVIKVYEEKSTELEYRQAVIATQQQYDRYKAQGINWPRSESVEKEVLRHFVSNFLLQHVGHDLHLAIPEILLQDQEASLLASLPPYFFDAKGQLNQAMLERLIAPLTLDAWRTDIENQIKANLLQSLISLGSYVAKFEVAAQYTEDYADKSYTIVTFSLEKALHDVKAKRVSDEALEKFYKKSEHGDMYKSVEKRAGTYWKFDVKDYGLSISKADVSAYYDAHKQTDYLEAPAQVQVRRIFFTHEAEDAKFQAQTVREELQKDPTTFAAVAKKIAAAKLPSQGSEKTDFFAKDTTKYDKILVDTAFEQLAQDHDISDVIKTDKGYEVLQRITRKSAKYKPLDDVYHSIEEKLLEEKFAKRFKQDAERVVSNAGYNKEGLIAFIDKKHGHKETISLEPKSTGIIGMQLFQTEQGHYAVFMFGKEGILLECTQIQKRALKPFEDIKGIVTADYYKKQAQHELEKMAFQAIKDAANIDLHEVAKKYDAHIQIEQVTYKNGQLDQSAILRRPEIALKIKALQSAGAMVDVVTPTESFVIRLDNVAQIDETLLNEKKSTIENTLASKAKYKGRDSFIASLYRHAKLNSKIEIKDQLLNDTKDTLL